MGHQEHQQRAQAELSSAIRCGVITISDTRAPETDTSGAAIRALLEAAGHTVARYQLVKDEPGVLRLMPQRNTEGPRTRSMYRIPESVAQRILRRSTNPAA